MAGQTGRGHRATKYPLSSTCPQPSSARHRGDPEDLWSPGAGHSTAILPLWLALQQRNAEQERRAGSASWDRSGLGRPSSPGAPHPLTAPSSQPSTGFCPVWASPSTSGKWSVCSRRHGALPTRAAVSRGVCAVCLQRRPRHCPPIPERRRGLAGRQRVTHSRLCCCRHGSWDCPPLSLCVDVLIPGVGWPAGCRRDASGMAGGINRPAGCRRRVKLTLGGAPRLCSAAAALYPSRQHCGPAAPNPSAPLHTILQGHGDPLQPQEVASQLLRASWLLRFRLRENL